MCRRGALFCYVLFCTVVFCLTSTIVLAKDTLIIALQDDIASLDPAKTFETAAMGIMGQVYEMLVGVSEDDFSQITPELATSWDLAEDGKSWFFHLRQDVLFASGNPLNADDVVFSLRRAIRLAGTPSWLLTQFGISEESITKIDNYTVRLVLERQYAPGLFLACLATHPVAAILDRKLLMQHEQDGDMGSAWLEEHSAGSGPYVLQKRKRGKSTEYVLNANELFHGGRTQFQKIIVRGVHESIEQMFLLEQGEIDIAWNLQPEQVEVLGNNLDIRISEARTLYDVYIGMNQGYAPLQRPEVRKAIRYAINYDGLIENVLGGAGVKNQTFISQGLLGYNSAMPYNYSSGKAKELLAQGGYPDGFETDLNCLNYSPWVDIARQIKSDLADIGIDVTIVQLTVDEMLERWFARETQLFVWEWGVDYADPDAKAKPFAHSDSLGDDASVQQVAWWFKYVNEETSKLVEEAAQELDLEKRAALYRQITEIILHDGPFAFLFTKVHQYAVRSEVMDALKNPQKVVIPFPQLKFGD